MGVHAQEGETSVSDTLPSISRMRLPSCQLVGPLGEGIRPFVRFEIPTRNS